MCLQLLPPSAPDIRFVFLASVAAVGLREGLCFVATAAAVGFRHRVWHLCRCCYRRRPTWGSTFCLCCRLRFPSWFVFLGQCCRRRRPTWVQYIVATGSAVGSRHKVSVCLPMLPPLASDSVCVLSPLLPASASDKGSDFAIAAPVGDRHGVHFLPVLPASVSDVACVFGAALPPSAPDIGPGCVCNCCLRRLPTQSLFFLASVAAYGFR